MFKEKNLHTLILFLLFAVILFSGCQSATRFSSRQSTKNQLPNSNYWTVQGLTQKQRLLLEEANRWLGTPYCFGGSDSRCVDCSGFVQNLFASVGVELPRTSSEQAKHGKAIELKNLAVGDLLFFGNRERVSHVAVYAGDGKIIHSSTSRGVVREPLSDSIMKNLAFVRRVLE